MTWMVEWKEYDFETGKVMTNSDSWDKWSDVVKIFNDCIADEFCYGAKVYCFMGDNLYPTEDPIVLEYRP